MRRLAVAAALSLTLGACGGDEPRSETADSEPDSARLTLENSGAVAQAALDLSEYCVAELRDGLSSEEEYTTRTEALDTLIRVFRSNPEGIYQPGGEGSARTMRQVLSDEASDLDACDPEGARELDRALEAGG